MPTVDFRQIPAVDSVLASADELLSRFGKEEVTRAIRSILDELRTSLRSGTSAAIPSETEILQTLYDRLMAWHKPSLVKVLNLSGTVLHTNLGRAVLPDNALLHMQTVGAGFSNLEFELSSAERGDRDRHVEELILKITGGEAATVVNNNAAAVLLALAALASGREVPVSRGELVEIGGSFRIPEVMSQSGCKLIEIGATNRTHLSDYHNAINEHTALLLKVHTSNYEIQGFSSSVPEAELAALAHDRNLPFMTDLGSGTLVDLTRWGLPDEPTVQSALTTGADVVTFSGDKLLGGPQCGIIVGSKACIAQIKRHPLKRALRVDKLTIAALFGVLELYLDLDTLPARLPTLRYLSRKPAQLTTLAEQVLAAFKQKLEPKFDVSVVACKSQIGSGSLPVSLLDSVGVKMTPVSGSDRELTNLASSFRLASTPVVGRLHDGSLLFDLRTLDDPSELNQLVRELSL